MTSFGGKTREMSSLSSQADKLVEEATAENLVGPDWRQSLELCDLVNSGKISGQDAVRAIKKLIMFRNSNVQLLTLTLLETSVKNCGKMFSEVTSEKVLDEMVKIIDDRRTPKEDLAALHLRAWESEVKGNQISRRGAESLAPIFTPPQTVASVLPAVSSHDRQSSAEHSVQTPKEVLDVARNSVELLSTVLTSSPKSEVDKPMQHLLWWLHSVLRGDLTTTLVEQCRQSQYSVQRIIERAGDNDPVMFEAINVHNELQPKYEEATKKLELSELQLTLAQVEALEEDETPAGGREEELVRNRPVKSPVSR